MLATGCHKVSACYWLMRWLPGDGVQFLTGSSVVSVGGMFIWVMLRLLRNGPVLLVWPILWASVLCEVNPVVCNFCSLGLMHHCLKGKW